VLYSLDGSSFVSGISFSQSMTTNAISVYAGNWSGVDQTVLIDYAFDVANPIVPEDGNAAGLTVNVTGNGSVLLNPDQPVYQNGEVVELTAIADIDWVFDSWSGAAAGNANPNTITISGATVVQANFIQVADTQPPVIANVVVTPDSNGATVTWTTNEVGDSQVDYGLSSAYTDVQGDAALVASHSIALTGLTADTLYHFEVSSQDAAGNLGTSGDLSFTTLPPSPSSDFQSDDFSSGTLDTGIWTFIDPLGDAGLSLTGTQAEIFVPGTLHDVWVGDNSLPRVRQDIVDGDFAVEVGFDTPELGVHRSQGILIEQDDVNVLRIEFHDLGNGPQLFVASIFGSAGTVRGSVSVPGNGIGPMFLRVVRAGDDFEVLYSLDGSSFVSALTFNQPMTTNAISVYAGNWSGVDQTVLIDYAFDVANP
jgi:hypothetical protein